jgi:hypothetical protein
MKTEKYLIKIPLFLEQLILMGAVQAKLETNLIKLFGAVIYTILLQILVILKVITPISEQLR